MFVGLGAATVLAIGASAWKRRPSRVWPWASIACALALFVASGVARSSLETLSNLTADRSLLPDFLSLPGYLLLAAGLLGFWRPGKRRPNEAGIILDGLIAALALASLAWVFVLRDPDVVQATMLVKLVFAAYPSMSVFLVVVTLRIVFGAERERVPAFWSLVAGMTLMFVGDVLYMFAT